MRQSKAQANQNYIKIKFKNGTDTWNNVKQRNRGKDGSDGERQPPLWRSDTENEPKPVD